MQSPQVKYFISQLNLIRIDNIEVNIHVPQQLHVVRPHSSHKIHKSSQQILQQELQNIPNVIKQQDSNIQDQNLTNSAIIIPHIQTFDDKGQFIDQKNKIRISQNDQIIPNINKHKNNQQYNQNIQGELQEIQQQNDNQERNVKKLKHLTIQNIQDKDQFNLRNSRTKIQGQTQKDRRKRYLSQSNVQTYYDQNKHQLLLNELRNKKGLVPQRIIQQQITVSPKKERMKSARSLHKYNSSQRIDKQIQRMIVDQVDKFRKSAKNSSKKDKQQQQQPQMEAIKQEKQEQQGINIRKLEEARQKIQDQFQNLSKVTGGQIGPQIIEQGYSPFSQKQTIKQEPQEQKQQ